MSFCVNKYLFIDQMMSTAVGVMGIVAISTSVGRTVITNSISSLATSAINNLSLIKSDDTYKKFNSNIVSTKLALVHKVFSESVEHNDVVSERIHNAMQQIDILTSTMSLEQSQDRNGWIRYLWPRSQKRKMKQVLKTLDEIEQILGFANLMTNYQVINTKLNTQYPQQK